MRACGESGRFARLDHMRAWCASAILFMAVSVSPGVLTAASSVDEARECVAETLKKSDHAFTPAVRQAYLWYAEAVVRAKYGLNKINENTWRWFHKRPQILSAAAAAEYPINPNILLNFQRLGLALGTQKIDQWQQLALAYAIRHRDQLFPIDRVKEEWDPARLERLVSERRKGRGGDFALIPPEDYPEVSEEERRLGEWVAGPQSLGNTRPPLTIPELMNMPLHEINQMTRRTPDDPPMVTKFPNWERVAIGGKVFPPYVDCTPTPQRALLMKIYRNGRIPAKTNRPAFKMERADWPILLYVADLSEIDETSFIFNYFVTHKEVPPLGLGQKTTASGQADMTPRDPNFRYARSNWNPRKFIRIYNGIKKDQGGRSWAWGLNALNVAATPVAAPPDGKFYYMGERGRYTYHMSCADNSFTGTGSSAQWFLPKAESVEPSQPLRGAVRHNVFMGLAATLNQGLQGYEDGRMAMGIIELLRLSRPQRIALLESAFLANPLHGDVIYRLAAEYRESGDVKGTLRLLTAVRVYGVTGFKLPVSPTGAKAARETTAKVFRSPEPSYQNLPVVPVGSSPWFFLLCSDVAVAYLRHNNGVGKEAFREELAYERKAASGCGDKPIVRALEVLQELTR